MGSSREAVEPRALDSQQALDAFAALSQATRLDVFRLLISAGASGLPAGEIGERLGVRQNTMSAHLGVLARAGLAKTLRDGRSIRYSADYEHTQGLLLFLMADCCLGDSTICVPVFDAIACCKTQ